MFITEEQAEERLTRTENYCSDLRGKHDGKRGGENSGRTIGAKGIPDKIRLLAGFNAHFEKAKSVGAALGISPISAHMAKQSIGHPEVKKKIDEKLEIVREDAVTKMLAAMGVVTVDKIEGLKPHRALAVAKDFAHILDKATPKIIQQNSEAVKIMIYAPGIREEKDYQTVEILNG
jgi:pyrroloquinoline quinone (PQQ) biosynthesis protein C